MWFRGEDIVGADGANVTSWPDYMDATGDSKLYSASALTGSGTPGLVETSGVSSLKSVQILDAYTPLASGLVSIINDRTVAAKFSGRTAISVYLVAHYTSTVDTIFALTKDGGSNPVTISLTRSSTLGMVAVVDLSSDGSASRTIPLGPISQLADGAHLFGLELDLVGGTAALYVDGQLWGASRVVATGSLSTTGSGAPFGSFIYGGLSLAGGSVNFNNYLSDLVFYPSILSTADRHLVEDALATKFSLTLHRVETSGLLLAYYPSVYPHGTSTGFTSYTNAITANSADVGSLGPVYTAYSPNPDIIQGTAGRRPALDLPAGYLEFDIDASNIDNLSYAAGSAIFPTTGDITIVVGMSVNASWLANNSILLSNNPSTSLGSIYFATRATARFRPEIYRDLTGTTRRYLAETTVNLSLATDYLAVFRFNDTTRTWHQLVNNANHTGATSNSSGSTTANGVTISPSNNAHIWRFYGMELYNRYLTDQEATDVYNRFKQRMAI